MSDAARKMNMRKDFMVAVGVLCCRRIVGKLGCGEGCWHMRGSGGGAGRRHS